MTRQKFTIYAIREVGTIEPRYIGQTSRTPEHRLIEHLGEARCSWHARTPFLDWLVAAQDNLEAIEVSTAETRQDAKAQERLLIQSAARLGCRLFNRDHMPRSIKLALGRAA